MNDNRTPPGYESSDSEDDRLLRELAGQDKTIGTIDSFEPAADTGEDLERCYKIMRITPEASFPEIHDAFKKMTEAWHPDRYPHVRDWGEKSKRKLQEIRNAYEKLLRFHSPHDGVSQEDLPRVSPPAPPPERPGYSDRERRLPGFTSSELPPGDESPFATADSVSSSPAANGPLRKLLYRITGLGLPILVILILALLWPSLYHYEAINLGGREYPLRINRITSHTTYYNGKQWLVPPVQVETGQPQPASVAPRQPVQPLPPLQPAQPVSPVPPPQSAAQPVPPVQTSPSVQALTAPAQPSLPSNPSKGQITISGMPASASQPKERPAPALRDVPSPSQGDTGVNALKPYSIQITAYPDKEKADALAKQLNRKNIHARVEEVTVKGKGKWHRVLLGRFRNPAEARKYFQDHKLREAYPNSFIQKS